MAGDACRIRVQAPCSPCSFPACVHYVHMCRHALILVPAFHRTFVPGMTWTQDCFMEQGCAFCEDMIQDAVCKADSVTVC